MSTSKPLLRKPRPNKNVIINTTNTNGQQDQSLFGLRDKSVSTFTNPLTPPSSASKLLGGRQDWETEVQTPNTNKQISKHDKKWVIDAKYATRSTTANTNAVQKNLLKPVKPRGPGALPQREIKRQFPFLLDFLQTDDDIRYSKPPLFTLNDFIIQLSKDFKMSVQQVHQIVFSSANYKKITALIGEKIRQKHQEISFIDVDLDALEYIEDVPSRVPQHQVLYEMAAMIKERVKDALQVEVECKVRKLPKFTPAYKLGEAPHSEIIVFEKGKEIDHLAINGRMSHPATEAFFVSPKKHFQDSIRATSPFSKLGPHPTAILPLEYTLISNNTNMSDTTLRQFVKESLVNRFTSSAQTTMDDNVVDSRSARHSSKPLTRATSCSSSRRSQSTSKPSSKVSSSRRYSASSELSSLDDDVDIVFPKDGLGSERNSDENQISPSEIAILDCLMSGAIALSLKANFISELPDISPLIHTLTYLNLSYNCFQELPPEVILLKNLQILKLRNNPLSILPNYIDQLTNLQSLIVSFCLITTIPISLFKLIHLRILDISYNKICFLPKEISKLKNLKFFNVEGNELTSLPYTMLSMNIKKLRVRNNFMHPLLWEENSTNQPQQLSDIAALAFYHHGLNRRYALSDESVLETDKKHHLPTELRYLLKDSVVWCECCGGPQFGKGLRLIRPAKSLFGVRFLPLLFFACSPHCRSTFLNSDAEIVPQLYFTDFTTTADNDSVIENEP